MATDHVARQVFDLPEPTPLIVTEHRAHDCRCVTCGTRTRAAFPEGVSAPVQYGERISAFVLYLLHYQLLPEQRLAALMADLFGVKLVTATIARISQDCAHRFRDFADAVRDHVASASVKHMDETGFRISGKTQWLHIASTVWLTFYRVSAKRGSLLAKVTGIVVHDHWKPYYTMTGVLHALCNAHHLRELKALVEIEKEDWAHNMQRLLRRACHATNLAREQGVSLKPGLIALFDRRYDAILAEGLVFHEAQPALAKARRRGRPPRRVGHNLLLRLSNRKHDVLRFLTDPAPHRVRRPGRSTTQPGEADQGHPLGRQAAARPRQNRRPGRPHTRGMVEKQHARPWRAVRDREPQGYPDRGAQPGQGGRNPGTTETPGTARRTARCVTPEKRANRARKRVRKSPLAGKKDMIRALPRPAQTARRKKCAFLPRAPLAKKREGRF